MDLLLAIKEEEPLASSLGAFLPNMLCPTVYRCPHCRSIYKVVFGPGDVFLGEGQRTCSNCKKGFRDRSKEWPVISSFDRFLFLFPMVVGGWLLITLVACVLFFYEDWNLGNIPVLWLAAICLVMPLVGWFVSSGYQIRCSVHRFKLRGKTKAA